MRTKDKYGGPSTAQGTIKLFPASVGMTFFSCYNVGRDGGLLFRLLRSEGRSSLPTAPVGLAVFATAVCWERLGWPRLDGPDLVSDFDEDDLLLAIDLVELDLDDLALGGGNHAAGEGGLDG
jgi:hypothetical protein